MPKISFSKMPLIIEVESGANLMRALLDNNVPVASSCYGDGVCGRCKLTIVDGSKNLSAVSATEEILKSRLRLNNEKRISCQTQVLGDIKIDADYW